MLALNQISLSSYAFKKGCSFIGGMPYSNVLKGLNGQLVFMFNSKHSNNEFFQWVRINFDSNLYQEKELQYKGKSYSTVFLTIPQVINKKFLLTFRSFSKQGQHLLSFTK